jgi:hypothetical protein
MSEYQGWTGKQRVRALNWLNREYKAGRRVRPTICDGCGQRVGVIEAHSEDYSEPFGDHIGGLGLCYRCHMALHCRFKAPEAWVLYRQAICCGVRFAPFLKRNWFGFRAQHLIRFSPETLDGLGPQRPDVLGHATRSEPLDGPRSPVERLLDMGAAEVRGGMLVQAVPAWHQDCGRSTCRCRSQLDADRCEFAGARLV